MMNMKMHFAPYFASILIYFFKFVPFDSEMSAESTTAAKQTRTNFDMMRKTMSLPEQNAQFRVHKEVLDFFQIKFIST